MPDNIIINKGTSNLVHILSGGAGSPVIIRPITAAPSTLLTSLIYYYKMDETSGNRSDSGPNGYTLTDNNTVGSDTGKLNTAALLVSANSEFFSLADNSNIRGGNVDFTFAFWINLTSKTATQTIFSKWNNNGVEQEYIFQYENGSDRFRLILCQSNNYPIATANTFGAPSTGTWYFIMCGYNATTDKVFISVNNGAEDTADHSTGTNATANTTFNIGRNPDAGGVQYTDGKIDGFGFWKKVLSTDEKAALYNGGSGLDYPF